MRIHALALSGAIGSGKSTVAHILADTGAYHYVGFGNYLRDLCIKRGIEINRSNLQRLGQESILQGWQLFVSNVLTNSKWNMIDNIVIDGVRHVEALSALKTEMRGMPLFHIHLLGDAETLVRRTKKRDETSEDKLKVILSHESESHQAQLAAIADKVFDVSIDADKISKDIKNFVSGLI